MTLSNGPGSDDKIPQSGTALTPVDDTMGIAPFLAMAEETPRPRGLRGMMLDYSAHAAMIVGLIGFAWTVSDHVVSRPAPLVVKPRLSQVEPIVTKKPDAMAELRETNARMAQDIQVLRTNLETLRANVHQTPDQVRALSANLDTVKSGLSSTKSETTAALAQLTGRIEKLQHEASLKDAALKEANQKVADAERAPKVERQVVDTEATGSLPPTVKPTPVPPIKPQSAKFAQIEDPKKAIDDQQKPQVISGYVVREVYDGVALIESRRGPIEVVPGVSIPGAGVVKSIDRHGGGWTVTTTKGLVVAAAPIREPRRGVRDMYPSPYRDDF